MKFEAAVIWFYRGILSKNKVLTKIETQRPLRITKKQLKFLWCKIRKWGLVKFDTQRP